MHMHTVGSWQEAVAYGRGTSMVRGADAEGVYQGGGGGVLRQPSSSVLLLSSLEMSDTHVYEPLIRTLLGTASHFCEEVVLELRTPATTSVHRQPAQCNVPWYC